MSKFRETAMGEFLRRHRTAVRQLVAAILMLASAFYVYQAISDSIDQLDVSAFPLAAPGLALVVLGTLGTLVLSTLYHVVAVRRIEPHQAAGARVGLAYALGQVMRYVPGKVFGIVFQIKFLSGQVRGATIAIALLVQTFYDYAWTFALVACVLLSAHLSSGWPMALLPLVLVLVWMVHREGYLERLLSRPAFLRRFLADPVAGPGRRPDGALPATLLVAAVWLPMLAGIGLGLGGLFGMESAVVLGALYLAAAVLSLLLVVVPSGLVVREALFVWLGAEYGLQPAALVFVGLLLRVCLTACEVLNLLVFLGAARMAGAMTLTTTTDGASNDS